MQFYTLIHLEIIGQFLRRVSQCIISASTEIECGVPQGSVLGPIMFLYIAELQTLIQDSGLNPLHYADDTQI